MEQAGMHFAGFENSSEAPTQPSGKSADPRRESELRIYETGHQEDEQRHGAPANESHLSTLARTIENEIVPRLMLAHRAERIVREPLPSEGARITQGDIIALARLIVGDDDDAPQESVERILARGTSAESIYLDLLAPTARYLGELWEKDLCDFLDVTIGVGRLQRVLRELGSSLERIRSEQAQERRILLLPCPGEQHTFGLAMVADFFRRSGWEVADGPWGSAAEIAALVEAEWFDIVGFSVGAETHLEDLTQCIAHVRESARNMNIGIMVGGPIFAQFPSYVSMVGADATATDGKQAPSQAEQLIAAKTHQR